MYFKVLRKLPQGVVVAIPAALAGCYGNKTEMVFADWRAASRAFSKELRRMDRAPMHDRYGTCPLTPAIVKDGKVIGGLNPVYQNKAKAYREVKPTIYRTWTVTR